MPFGDFHARFYAESGDDRLIDRVSLNDSGAASAVFGTDGDGNYLRITAQLAVALGASFDPDATGGFTVAILFKKRATSNFFHWFAMDAAAGTFGGNGASLKHQSAAEHRVQVSAASATTLHNAGATADGDLIGLVLACPAGVVNPTWRLWIAGASHTGTAPDVTVPTTFGATQFAPVASLNFDQSGAADHDLYALGVWDEVLPDADCSTLVETLYSSIVTGTLGGGNLPPVFDGPDIAVPTLQEGVAMSAIDVSARFSDPEAGPLTYDKAGTWPSGVTVTAAGVIQGTPAAASAGAYTGLTVTATDGTTTTASNAFAITVNPPQGAIVVPALRNLMGGAVTGEAGLWAAALALADGAHVVTVSGLAQEIDGTVIVTDPAMVQGVDYILTLVNPITGARHVGRYTAA